MSEPRTTKFIETKVLTTCFYLILRQKKQICQMMTIYLVPVQRIHSSKTLSLLTTNLFFIISKHLLKQITWNRKFLISFW